MITLLRIEDRGMGLCAVFCYSHTSSQDSFALNAENLRLRIGNLERQNSDTSVEREALAEIERRQAAQ